MEPLMGPELPERRLARRREHLMQEIDAQGRRQGAGRRRLLVTVAAVGAAAVLVTGGAAVAVQVATGHPIWRQQDGSVAIDGSALRLAYEGRYLDLGELQRLQSQGKATISANNRELACQGISLYFDTDNQLQAYLEGFERRDAQYKAEAATLPPADDPCAVYAQSPRFITDPK